MAIVMGSSMPSTPKDSTGKLKIDNGKDLSMATLWSWVQNWAQLSKYYAAIVFEMGSGDPVIFNTNIWNSQSGKSDDAVNIKLKKPNIAPIITLLLLEE
jgi:hypothetical protein